MQFKLDTTVALRHPTTQKTLVRNRRLFGQAISLHIAQKVSQVMR